MLTISIAIKALLLYCLFGALVNLLISQVEAHRLRQPVLAALLLTLALWIVS